MKIIGMVIADDNEFVPVENFAKSMGAVEYTYNSDKTLEFKIDDKTVICALCGIGKVNAANSAAALIYGKGVDCIINFGLSGAISKLRKGELAVGVKYVEHDFDLTPIGYKPGIKPQEKSIYTPDKTLYDAVQKASGGMTDAVLVSGDMFVSDCNKKQFLVENFGANACDMESAAIASVCNKADVPFISFRSISDDADDSAVETYTAQNDKKQADMSEIAFAAVKML